MVAMSDTQRSILAGAVMVAGCLIGGLIIVSGVLADMPGAEMVMGAALLLLIPTTLGLIVFLHSLDKTRR
jgi:hypothetical protein